MVIIASNIRSVMFKLYLLRGCTMQLAIDNDLRLVISKAKAIVIIYEIA